MKPITRFLIFVSVSKLVSQLGGRFGAPFHALCVGDNAPLADAAPSATGTTDAGNTSDDDVFYDALSTLPDETAKPALETQAAKGTGSNTLSAVEGPTSDTGTKLTTRKPVGRDFVANSVLGKRKRVSGDEDLEHNDVKTRRYTTIPEVEPEPVYEELKPRVEAHLHYEVVPPRVPLKERELKLYGFLDDKAETHKDGADLQNLPIENRKFSSFGKGPEEYDVPSSPKANTPVSKEASDKAYLEDEDRHVHFDEIVQTMPYDPVTYIKTKAERFKESAHEKMGNASRRIGGAAHKTKKELVNATVKVGDKVVEAKDVVAKRVVRAKDKVAGAAHKTKKETVKLGGKIKRKSAGLKRGTVSGARLVKEKTKAAAHATKEGTVKFGADIGSKIRSGAVSLSTLMGRAAHKTNKRVVTFGHNVKDKSKVLGNEVSYRSAIAKNNVKSAARKVAHGTSRLGSNLRSVVGYRRPFEVVVTTEKTHETGDEVTRL